MLLPVRLLSVIPLNGLLKREKKYCNRLPDKFLQAGNFDQTDDNFTEPNIGFCHFFGGSMTNF
jgi:hypothetical protein